MVCSIHMQTIEPDGSNSIPAFSEYEKCSGKRISGFPLPQRSLCGRRRGGSGVVVCEVGVNPDDLAGEIEDLAEKAGDTADKSQGGEPEDGGKTLFGSDQKDQDERDNGHSTLAAIVDANTVAVLHEVVHQVHGHIGFAQKIAEFRNAGLEEENGRGRLALGVPEGEAF